MKRNAKYNVHQVLNCFFEYPEKQYSPSEIKSLCRRILWQCIEDIEHQRKEHPSDQVHGHILHALHHPELPVEVAKAKAQLVAFGEQYPDFQETELYKEAAGLFPFPTPQDLHPTFR